MSFGSFSLRELTTNVCIWRCEHARFCVEAFYALYINFHSFMLAEHPLTQRTVPPRFLRVSAEKYRSTHTYPHAKKCVALRLDFRLNDLC